MEARRDFPHETIQRPGWSVSRLEMEFAAAIKVSPTALMEALNYSLTPADQWGWVACPSTELMLIWLSKLMFMELAMRQFPHALLQTSGSPHSIQFCEVET